MSLDNDGDTIQLIDPTGSVIECGYLSAGIYRPDNQSISRPGERPVNEPMFAHDSCRLAGKLLTSSK